MLSFDLLMTLAPFLIIKNCWQETMWSGILVKLQASESWLLYLCQYIAN